ncbi:Hypothetical predicted protein, partial [Marmota monax]
CSGPNLPQLAQSKACPSLGPGFPREILLGTEVKADPAAFRWPAVISLWRRGAVNTSQPKSGTGNSGHCPGSSLQYVLVLAAPAGCSSSFSAGACAKGQEHLTRTLRRMNVGRTLVRLLMHSEGDLQKLSRVEHFHLQLTYAMNTGLPQLLSLEELVQGRGRQDGR